jgi:hypothetical protein
MCSLCVRFTVACVFNVIFEFLTLKMTENACDGETHTQTAHPKRKCNRPLTEQDIPVSQLLTQVIKS